MKRHGHIASSYAMALMLIANGVFAQDVVFSEPITAPLTLNPAWAGAVNDMEANLVQRTQQNPLGDPFRTLAAGFASSLKSKSESNAAGRSGVGVQLVSDRTSAMNTTQIALSFAHHVAITRNSSVGVGLQGGLLQTAQNGADGQWGSQYDGLQYDSSIPSGEASIRNKHTALDLGGGVVYAVHWGVGRDAVQNRFTAGISGQHLARPQLFSDPAQDRIAVRWAAFTQARLLLGKPTNYLAPAAYFFAQGPSNIAIVGGAFGHVFGADGTEALHPQRHPRFLPGGDAAPQVHLQHHRKVFQKYGFLPLETPAMENPWRRSPGSMGRKGIG
jgi:type IX secretion system PorP/SprF family membrane protein